MTAFLSVGVSLGASLTHPSSSLRAIEPEFTVTVPAGGAIDAIDVADAFSGGADVGYVASDLPPGLALSSDGVLSGTAPETPGQTIALLEARGRDGAVAQAILRLVAVAQAPTLSSVSLSGTGLVGEPLAAIVAVRGTEPVVLRHQWRRDGLAIDGAHDAGRIADALDDGAEITVLVEAENAAGADVAESAGVRVVRRAPVASGAPLDVDITQGAGAVIRDAGAFIDNAQGGAWSVTVDGAPTLGLAVIDSAGVVTIADSVSVAASIVTARYANSGGAAAVSFRVTVREAATPALSEADWTITTRAGADRQVLVNILASPTGGDPILGYEWRVGAGAPNSLAGGVAVGVRSIELSAADAVGVAAITLRAVSAAGPGPWSDVKTVTPGVGVNLLSGAPLHGNLIDTITGDPAAGRLTVVAGGASAQWPVTVTQGASYRYRITLRRSTLAGSTEIAAAVARVSQLWGQFETAAAGGAVYHNETATSAQDDITLEWTFTASQANLNVGVAIFNASAGRYLDWADAVLVAVPAALIPSAGGGGTTPAGGDWSVFDAVEMGTTAYLWIEDDADLLTPAPDSIEYRVGASGEWRSLPPVAGLHKIADLTADTANDVYLRAVVGGAPGAASAAKSVTPTAASLVRFLAFADEDPRHTTVAIAEDATGLARDGVLPSAANLNFAYGLERTGGAPGGEIEFVNASSRYVTHARYAYQQTTAGAPKARLYDPAGCFAHLARGATEGVPFRLTTTQNGTQNGVVIVAGACGSVAIPSRSVMALDADGDPFPIRLDRTCGVGKHPDGRAWVKPYGGDTVAFLSNDGSRHSVTVSAANPVRVVSIGGVLVTVTRTPGLWPAASANETFSAFTRAYTRVGGTAPSWTGTSDGTHSLLTVVPNFEHLHLFLDVGGSGECAVRFRKTGTATWHPAQPLDYSAASNNHNQPRHPGRHRGVIRHLEPGASYDVEVKQGSTVWRQTVSTRSYKPTKTGYSLPAASAGRITLSTSGAANGWREYGPATVQGAEVYVNAEYVILRGLRIHGGECGVRLGPNAKHVRIVDCDVSGWSTTGNSDPASPQNPAGYTGPKTDVWSNEESAGVFALTGVMPEDVLVYGCRFGSPRHPAAAWEEYHPAAAFWHATGSQAIKLRDGGVRQIVVTDCAASPHPLRNFEDGFGGTAFNAQETQGFPGPAGVVAWNFVSGSVDDTFEIEGLNAATEIADNVLDSPVYRRGVAHRATLAVSPIQHGPIYALRNVHRVNSPAGGGSGNTDNTPLNLIKGQRNGGFQNTQNGVGHLYLFNETVAALAGRPNNAMTHSGAPWHLTHTTVRNGLYRAQSTNGVDSATGSIANSIVATGSTDGAYPGVADHTYAPLTAPGTAATVLANVTDSGPFADATPRIGAV